MASSLFILPPEIVYQILDYLDNFTIYFSLQNVSSRMNTIVHDYDRYRSFNTLYVDYRKHSTQFARHVNNALRHNKTLTMLYVRGMGPLETHELASALRENLGLIKLNIRANQIGNQGAEYLVDVLRQNNTLTTIDLAGNEIGPRGAYYVATVLPQNKTLKVLNLSFNQLGPRGAEQLANALQDNQTLVILDLQFNEVGDTGKWRARRILENNATLQLLL